MQLVECPLSLAKSAHPDVRRGLLKQAVVNYELQAGLITFGECITRCRESLFVLGGEAVPISQAVSEVGANEWIGRLRDQLPRQFQLDD